MDKAENFEKHTSLKNDENVSVSSKNNKLQIAKESILQSDQIQEKFKNPNVTIATSKKRKFVRCKYCSDHFHSKLKFQVHRNLCKVYHKFIGKGTEGFQCVICSFNDSDRNEMLKHMKINHRNDRLYNLIDGENVTHVTGNRIRIISRNENTVNSLPVETVATNEDSKSTNENLDKDNDTIDYSQDIIKGQFISETTGIDFNNCSKPVEKSSSDSDEKNHEELSESPISNLAENTDDSIDPFPEYENIHSEEDSKTHSNLKIAEKKHKTPDDKKVTNIEEEEEHLEANNDFQKYDSVNNEDFVVQKVS